MGGISKRRIGAIAVTGLVIAGIVGASSMSVSGVNADPYPGTVAYGTLTIAVTDRAGSVTLDLVNGPTLQQAISTVQPCSTIALGAITVIDGQQGSLNLGGNLLDFTSLVGSPLAIGGSVQIPSTLLGVESGTNCGTPSGQLGPDEALELSLGSFADFTAKGVSAQSGSLRINKTHPQDKKLQVAYDTTDFGPEIDVAAGLTDVTTEAFDDSITLKSTATSNARGLSLATGTTFNLVMPSVGDFEKAVFCGETVPATGGTGQVAQNATYLRGEVLPYTGKNICEDVGVTVDILNAGENGAPTGGVVFWNTATAGVTGNPQSVSGTVTVNWAPVSPSDPNLANILQREIDYDAGGALPFVPVQWCTSFSQADTNGNGIPEFTVVRPQGNTAGVFDGTLNSGGSQVPWCLVSDTQELVGGQIIQTQVYYGFGDPWNR